MKNCSTIQKGRPALGRPKYNKNDFRRSMTISQSNLVINELNNEAQTLGITLSSYVEMILSERKPIFARLEEKK